MIPEIDSNTILMVYNIGWAVGCVSGISILHHHEYRFGFCKAKKVNDENYAPNFIECLHTSKKK